MPAEISGPLSPTFTVCPCCGHWGSNFPAHCPSDTCRWLECTACRATIGAGGAHLAGSSGGAHARCHSAH